MDRTLESHVGTFLPSWHLPGTFLVHSWQFYSWGVILFILRSRLGRGRDSRVPMIDVAFSTVRPDPESEPNLEEQRLEAAVLPFRIKLSKSLVQFMQVRVGG